VKLAHVFDEFSGDDDITDLSQPEIPDLTEALNSFSGVIATSVLLPAGDVFVFGDVTIPAASAITRIDLNYKTEQGATWRRRPRRALPLTGLPSPTPRP
jgi:hypothetical protein